MNSAPGILIVRLSALGDILHTLPAFLDLKETFPECRIDWLVSKKCGFLLSAVSGIGRIHIVDTDSLLKPSGGAAAWRQFAATVRNVRRSRYDVSIDFQGLLKTALLGSLSGARIRIGFSGQLVRERPAHWFYQRRLAHSGEQIHVIELNRRLAEVAGARRSNARCVFDIMEQDRAHTDALLKKERLTDFVVINPGGGWPTKRWQPEKYGMLAAKIQHECGLPVVVTTGPGEDPLFQGILKTCGNPAPRHFPVSFLQLVPLLEKARLLIGGDTGPFHLACAVGTPVVGVFGPTSPVRNGPWRGSDEVVVHRLSCSYCYGRTCPTKNECMDVSVDEVFDAVIRRLGNH